MAVRVCAVANILAGVVLVFLCIALPFPGPALIAMTVGASVPFSVGIIQLLEYLSGGKRNEEGERET